METLPTPTEQALAVIEQLNAKLQPDTPYQLVGEAQYAGRSFAFATVTQQTQTISVLFDMTNGGGSIRSALNKPEPIVQKQAPFVTTSAVSGTRGLRTVQNVQPQIKLDSPIHERDRNSIADDPGTEWFRQ